MVRLLGAKITTRLVVAETRGDFPRIYGKLTLKAGKTIVPLTGVVR